MKYYNPIEVKSPRDFVENVELIYDGGSGENIGETGFSIVKLNWEGVSCHGMRWNVARREWDDDDKVAETKICSGIPVSRGYPVWFIIPEQLVDSIINEAKKIKQ
ncbi:MAG: hypothetical protein K9G64_04815 [Bacteroidia bacterium]|nr:hypothetical protein [Bacteroidia bacterium]